MGAHPTGHNPKPRPKPGKLALFVLVASLLYSTAAWAQPLIVSVSIGFAKLSWDYGEMANVVEFIVRCGSLSHIVAVPTKEEWCPADIYVPWISESSPIVSGGGGRRDPEPPAPV